MQAYDPRDIDQTAHLRTILEEELGEIVHLAQLPASAIEEVAARLTRIIAPHLAGNGAAAQQNIIA